MLSYDERKQAARDKKEREQAEVKRLFPEVVKQVARELGLPFRIKDYALNAELGGRLEEVGRVIHLSTSEYSPDFRLSVSGNYYMGPSELSISWPHGTARPSITVSMRRDAAVIAKEIKSRFLPDYDAACTKIAERVKQATDFRNSRRAATDRLAAVAGVKVREVYHSNPKELQNEFFKYYGKQEYTGPKLEVKVSSAESIGIEVDCDVELAAAIIKAIDALANPKPDPRTEFCGNCGHSREDHDSDSMGGQCWNGSGHGNRCACTEYANPNDAVEDHEVYFTHRAIQDDEE